MVLISITMGVKSRKSNIPNKKAIITIRPINMNENISLQKWIYALKKKRTLIKV